jgi:hypothetical protein
VRPQLGRLLAAERSAVVAEEDQDGGTVAPEIAEADVAVLGVLDDGVRELHGAL